MNKKQVKDFHNYEIYEDGRLYSYNTNKFLKPFPISRKNKEGVKGYLAYKLCSNGFEKTVQVHRLVAIHFIPNPENKEEVNHINGDKANNCISNLEWSTRLENIRHSFKTGLNSGEKWAGIKHSRASFTEAYVRDVCILFSKGKKPIDITGGLVSKELLQLYNKLYRIYKKDNWKSISQDYTW